VTALLDQFEESPGYVERVPVRGNQQRTKSTRPSLGGQCLG